MKIRQIITLLALVASIANVHANSFGRIPGQYAVSSVGSARYSIPIWTPPGIRGIQPAIRLTYDSNLSYGLMGPGWTLSGLSTIARCNRTFAQDSAPAPITLTFADAFCLDGNRLRLTSSETLSTYGQAGTTYQTEIANFSNVTANGTAGNGPSYFTVQGKDGLIYEYGNTTDSRIFPSTSSTTPYIWALDKVTDRLGNSMTFTYYQAGGAYVPLSIQYTAPSGSTAFPYQVNFNYGTKATNDLTYKFVAGSQIQQTRQLSNITIKSSGTIVREYNLSYTTSATTLRATLTSIQECGGSAGSDCYSTATSIGYQSGTAGVPTPTTATGSGATSGTMYSVDIDGDGKKDLVFQTSSGQWWVQLATATGYGTPISTGASGGTILLDDFDGAGRNELLAPSGGFWCAYKLSGGAFSMTPTTIPFISTSLYSVADIDGDGLPDLVQLTAPSGGTSSLTVQLNTSSTSGISFAGSPTITQPFFFSGISGIKMYGDNQSPNSPVSHFDFNGDGRSDIIIEGKQVSLGWIAWEYAYNGTTFVQTGGASLGTGSTPFPFVALNFNDDACTDLMGSATLQISECNSNGFLDLNIPSGTALLAVDWDGDGRTDILANVGGILELYRSEGNAFAPGVSTGISAAGGSYIVTDQNGDGLHDLVLAKSAASNALYYALHGGAGIKPDLATSFVDGYGNAAKPTYVSIAQSNYQNKTDATYPYQNYIGPLYVVNGVTFSDPSNMPSGTYSQTYTYYGAWTNLQGRGFSGFEEVQRYDSRNALWNSSFNDVKFPYIGILDADYVTQDQAITKFVNASWINRTYTLLDGTPNNQRYFPYINGSVVRNSELGGALDAQLITSASTSYAFDNYGNATTVSTTVTDNDPNSPYANDTWTTTTVSTISPDTSTWCLSLPTEMTITRSSTAAGGAAITRTIAYNNPDYTNCRQTEKVIEPNSATYKVVEDFGYDTATGNFGNLHTDTVTGVGMAPRTTTITWTPNGQFPQTIANPLSQSVSLTFDPNTGMKTSETDLNYTTANPLKTQWMYDDFAREISESRPDGTSTTFSYNNCATGGCVNSNNTMTVTVTAVNIGGSTLAKENIYLDGLERPLVTSSTMLNGAFDRREVQYNSLGLIYQEGIPCTFIACANYWVTHYYDGLNRLTKLQRPISSTNPTLQTTMINYQGRTTAITDPNGNTSTRISQVTGNLGRTQDPSGYFINFTYDAFGSMLSAVDNLSNTLTSASYLYGLGAFRQTFTDTDLGPRSFTTDALGEVTSYSDAKGQNFAIFYDALSRPTSRTEPDLTTTWTWGNTANSFNIGKLQSISSVDINGTRTEAYSYDSKTRLSSDQIIIPGDSTYTYTLTYNATTGLLDTLMYPVSTSSYQMKLQYTYANGILQKVSDISTGGPGTTYWTANTMNPAGQTLQETLGNGVVVNHTFDAVTGWVGSIQAGLGGGATLQNNSYLFDEVGNLTQRQDGNLGTTENVFPDHLNRLDHTVGDTNTQMTYDAMGRIATWEALSATTNVLDYTTPQSGCTYYANSQLHAVRKDTQGPWVGSFCYDANGNTTSSSINGTPTYSFAWTSFNQPSYLAWSTSSSQFFYDANHQRYKQLASYNGTLENTIYIGGLLEKMSNSSGTAYRHYIPVGNNTVVYTRTTLGANSTYYLTKDHLGSTAVITDQTGSSLVKEQFSALGWNENTGAQQTTMASVSRHEFTGHEGIDNLGMVNMNGRTYIPSGSHFISPDPYVADPGNTQSFNRYSYVNNNPLTLVDPSGYDPLDAIVVNGELGGPENPLADVATVVVEAAELFGFSDIFGFGTPSLTPNQRLAQSHGIDVSGQIQGVPSFQSLGSNATVAAEDGNSTLSEVVVTAHQWHLDPGFIQGFSQAFLDAWVSGPHANTELSVSVTRPEASPDQLETVTINGYRYPYRDDPLDIVPGWAAIRCVVLSNCGTGEKIFAAIPIIAAPFAAGAGSGPVAGKNVLSLGRWAGLTEKAAAEGGQVVQATGDAQNIWRTSYRAIRSADEIVFHTTGVPTNLAEQLGTTAGQFSRAESIVIQARPDLLAKTIFVP